jgi:diguanylate cyclase (GGDEF)-like protein/PAS domain S-box-containing protein
MNGYSILSLLSFIIYIHLGIEIYRNNMKAKENKLFLALCISFAIWSFGYTFIYPSHNDDMRNFWYKISAFGWCTYSSIILHFVLTKYGHGIMEKYRWLIFIIYCPSIALLLMRITLFKSNKVSLFIYNSFTLMDGIYYVGYTVLTMLIVINNLKHNHSNRERREMTILIKSGFISFILGFINQTLLPFFGYYSIPPIAQILSLIWVCGIWYSVKIYSFMDIKKLVTTEAILNKLNDMIVVIDYNGYIISMNEAVLKISQYKEEQIVGQKISSLLENLKINHEDIIRSAEISYLDNDELFLLTKGKDKIPLSISISRIKDTFGEVVGLVIVGQDIRLVKKLQLEIEENQRVQEELSYLSFHDSLTGLHNRSSFENRMKYLEEKGGHNCGIIICDLDGLKLVNDTLGHKEGDELIMSAARVISKSLKDNWIAARIGGDEFAIILEETSEEDIKKIYKAMTMDIIEHNKTTETIPLSVSIGFAVSSNKTNSMKDIFKEADNNMYREKLMQSQKTKDAIVKALIKALLAKDFITEGHADRVYKLMELLSSEIDIPKYKYDNLWLFAQFHDIGKVGIPDSILFKPHTLNVDEYYELKRHCEIGYRIARSSPELEPIADFILKHHEWWDGSGYPLGIKGDEIPLECRVLAIVDAFDVMTTNRPYRSALSIDEALEEIKRGAGGQFDPIIANKFVSIMKNINKLGA